MKNLPKNCYLLALLLFVQILSGQNDVSGKVIYKQRYVKSSASKKKKSFNDFEDRIYQQINNLVFTLKFNRSQYSFSHQEKMEMDNNRDFKLALSLGNGKGIYYGNIKNNLRLHKKQSFGSNFIVKSSFKELQWQIHEETKVVGKYKCQKATFSQDIYTSKGKKKRLVTAWYTNEIPFPFGPVGYGNLPGLIIELHIGKYIFYAEKIKLSNSKLKIAPPKGEKILSEDEFNLLSKKMYESRKERY